MTDLLGPANAANAVTTRPNDTRAFGPADTWFRPCTTSAAQDGTQLQAVFFNGLLANLRNLVRANGLRLDGVTPVIPESVNVDALLIEAILQLIQRGQANYGTDTGTSDALVVTPTTAVIEYLPGMRFLVLKNPNMGANGTTKPTINFGLGNLTVTKNDASPIGIGDLKKAGLFEVELDGAGHACLTDLLTLSDILALGGVVRVTDGPPVASTAQALVGTASPAISAYAPNQIIIFTAGANNTAANPTLNVTGGGGTALGPLTIVKKDLSSLNQGDLLAGTAYTGVPDAAGGKIRLLGVAPTDTLNAMTAAGVVPTHCIPFQSSGSWTPPAGIVNAYAEGNAGGGGGGGGSGHGGGGGGGGGGYFSGPFKPTPGVPVPITIGAGGVGGTADTSNHAYNGTAGGTTSVGSFMSATGGTGGGGGADGVAGTSGIGGQGYGPGNNVAGDNAQSGGSTGPTGIGTGGGGGGSYRGGAGTSNTGGSANGGSGRGGGGGGGAGGNGGANGAPGIAYILF